jgi:formamidopyrimidine-DNA glycosylase
LSLDPPLVVGAARIGDPSAVPELPEVETVRRRLAPLLEGRTLSDVRVLDTRLVAPVLPAEVAARLEGATVERLDRRGKYLLVHLAGGDLLIAHLRMTGNFLHVANGAPEPSHLRASARLDDGTTLLYTDIRRFGTWVLLDPVDAEAHLAARLGPEPLGDAFGAAVLRQAFRGRRAPVKAVLLDQRVVAGVGNIYADEALFRARVHPLTPAAAVSGPAVARIAAAVREVLELGIEAQGATLRDFRTPTGGYGSMQERFLVYGRDGEPCVRCGATIVRTVVGGRGTHLCPRCQRRPRAARA